MRSDFDARGEVQALSTHPVIRFHIWCDGFMMNKICQRMAVELEKELNMRLDEDQRWKRVQAFIEESATILDLIHWRVLCKRYGKHPASPLFQMVADSEGELTEAAVVEQIEAIARQARAGFVEGEGFPVFGSLEDRIK